MTTMVDGQSIRKVTLGNFVTGKLQTISGAATHQVFTVAGGPVLITAMWGITTTAMAGANTVNVQTDPTTGDTVVIATATDLGTTDTAAGTVICGEFDQDGTTNTPSLVKGSGEPLRFVAPIGEIESVATEATADGAIQWYCTFVPLDAGGNATVTASA
jgi:hypothetical protein